MEEKIKEINESIEEALDSWADIMLHADADDWSYMLNYSDKAMFNALYIFTHVLGNKAIKNGYYTSAEDAEEKMNNLVKAIGDCYGVDSKDLTDKVMKSIN